MRDVEGHGISGLSRRQRKRVAGLGLVLLENGIVLEVDALRLLVDLAVQDREHRQLLVEEAFVMAVDIGELVPRSIDLEVVRVGDEDPPLGVGLDFENMALERRSCERVGRNRLRVFPLAPDPVEILDPILAAGGFRLFVGLRIVFGVIAHVVVLRRIGREEGSTGREIVQQAGIRRREAQPETRLVDLLDFDRLARGHPGARRARMQILVLDDVVEIEDHVVRRERRAVGPAMALAQRDGDLPAIVAPAPGARDVRHDRREIVTEPHEVHLAPAEHFSRAGFERA